MIKPNNKSLLVLVQIMVFAAVLVHGGDLGALIAIRPTPPTVAAAESMWEEWLARSNAFPGRARFTYTDANHPQHATNSMLYGLTGYTGIGWQGASNNFCVPVTALTRRHVYWRGHDTGRNGWQTPSADNDAIFIGQTNTVHRMKLLVQISRNANYVDAYFVSNGVSISSQIFGDYSIGILTEDLPGDVTPLPMVTSATAAAIRATIGPPWGATHWPPGIGTEQGNYVGPLNEDNLMKSGDSGSPNMWIYNGALYMEDGRTTSGYSTNMQNDLDALTLFAGLSTNDYQPTFLSHP